MQNLVIWMGTLFGTTFSNLGSEGHKNTLTYDFKYKVCLRKYAGSSPDF